jgi:hypothetical protein
MYQLAVDENACGNPRADSEENKIAYIPCSTHPAFANGSELDVILNDRGNP